MIFATPTILYVKYTTVISISMNIVYTCIYFSNIWNWITSNGIKTIHAVVSQRKNTSVVVKHSDTRSTV